MVKGRNTTVIGIRILDSDWDILHKAAKEAHQTVSAYVKSRIMECVWVLQWGETNEGVTHHPNTSL